MSPVPKHIPLGKSCPKAANTLQKIAMRYKARETTAFRVLKGSYERLKKERGVNFHSLHEQGYTTQMMMDLGIPTHELIIGHLSTKGGLDKLVADITKMHNSNDPHYKKLRFKTLVSQGIPLNKIHEARAQLGLLLYEGFTKQELVEAGYNANTIDNILKWHKERREKKP